MNRELLNEFWFAIAALFLVWVFAINAKAHDGPEQAETYFEFIQPVDNGIRSKLEWDNKALAGTISDWTMYAMVAAPAVSLIDERDGLRKLGGVVGGHLAVAGITELTKQITKRKRPIGNSTKSFFSGHTSAAFAGAGMLCQTERKEICHAGLILAATTGYMRIAGGRHWFSDTFIGATVGFFGGAVAPQIIVSW